jgi:hypothetical protein
VRESHETSREASGSMADQSSPAGGAGGLGARAGGAASSSRRQRAPVSTFAIQQEVLAWHRTHGWISAIVHSVRSPPSCPSRCRAISPTARSPQSPPALVPGRRFLNPSPSLPASPFLSPRDDGKYVLNWTNGDETDRIKTRTNLRKGIKDQMKNSAKASSAPLAVGSSLREDGAVSLMASSLVGDGGVPGGEMSADGVKIGSGEVVISGGEVYGGSAEGGVGGAAEPGAHGGGLKADQQDALAAMAGAVKREKKMSLDGENEEDDGQAEIQNGSRPVPPPLSAGGWSKSEHRGLMSMWFQTKRWYHCEQCDYLNDRLYHSKMHYERIHVKNGKQQFHKRKHTNATDSPTAGKDDGGGSAMEDDPEDDDSEGRRLRLKAKQGTDKEGQGILGDKGNKSPIKGLKAATKGAKGFPQAGLDVLATLVTAEANAKGEGGVNPMSMKAWLEMQVSLAAKTKLAAAEMEAKDEAGRDAKRARTRVADASTPTSPAGDKNGAAKKVGTPRGKGDGSSLGAEGEGSAFDEYQKAYQTALAATSAFTCATTPAAAAAAMEEYSKAYNKAIAATAAIDWTQLPAGVVSPLLLASLATSTSPGPDVSTDGDAKGKGEAGKGKEADGTAGLRLDVGQPATNSNSLEGGVAVLLDAMRRHSEEGGSAAKKAAAAAKVAKGGKKPGSGEAGDEAGALGDMSSLDVAAASALSALIPPWLLQQLSASGLGGGLLGLGGDALPEGQRAEGEGEGKDDAKDDGKPRAKKDEDDMDMLAGGMGGADKKGDTGDVVSREGESLGASALTMHHAHAPADDGTGAEANLEAAAMSVEGIPPPPAPPPAPLPGSEAEDALQAAQAAAAVMVDGAPSPGIGGIAAAGKGLQMADPKVYQARTASRWPGGLTSEGLVKEPRGKSRREVKNALQAAQTQQLVTIVGDEGSLSRDPTMVEAGVLLPLPGGRSDEAIMRVDFLFDLATLEGRKKRAQFFKLINGAVGQMGREHSLHNSVVNVIKNMCFMPGSWEPGSPTANWKDAQCWKFRKEMLDIHVNKMREEAQNRKRKRESHGGGNDQRQDASAGVAHVADAHQRDDAGGAGLAAGFKEEVRATMTGLGGIAVHAAVGGTGIKVDGGADGGKGKVGGMEGLAGGALAKVGEGGLQAAVAGQGLHPAIGGIGVLLEVVCLSRSHFTRCAAWQRCSFFM